MKGQPLCQTSGLAATRCGAINKPARTGLASVRAGGATVLQV